ncbi:MAG: MFS transporter [Phycisphaerales bacterium]|nr:MAG: MFS transporter [Phycisphaerales bacterium]
MSPTFRHDPGAAMRLPAFRAYVISRATSGAAMTIVQAVIAWQVYEISGSTLQLGMIGLVRFVPALGVSLIGGAAADVYDRRRIILLAQVAPLLATLAVLAAIANDEVSLLLLYAVVLVSGLASSFENPARQALLPQIVPREAFTNAITVNSTVQSLSFVTGPTVAGLLIGWNGEGAAYLASAGCTLVAVVSMLFVRGVAPPTVHGRVTWEMVREGVSFVRHRPVLLGAMTLDMFAVILGGAKALLPVYATDILHVGAVGYGVLSGSLEVGALLMSGAMIWLPPVRQTGRVLLASVAAFGLATIAFGLARSFPVAVVAYALVGMSDQVSVVMRQTTIQLATPDALRGRVTAVNAVFISASNQLGMVESGLVAAVTGATFAVVSGGAGCIAIVALMAARVPSLRRYRTDGSSDNVETLAAG